MDGELGRWQGEDQPATADATRAALAKVLGTRAVNALRAEGIEVARPISDQGWGLLTAIALPGGVELGLYQPRHPTATQPG